VRSSTWSVPEASRARNTGGAPPPATHGTIAVHFAAARIHHPEVAFAVGDFPTELHRADGFGGRRRSR
jgi:hypothetical protein